MNQQAPQDSFTHSFEIHSLLSHYSFKHLSISTFKHCCYDTRNSRNR